VRESAAVDYDGVVVNLDRLAARRAARRRLHGRNTRERKSLTSSLR
jgi:hypothetical protein